MMRQGTGDVVRGDRVGRTLRVSRSSPWHGLVIGVILAASTSTTLLAEEYDWTQDFELDQEAISRGLEMANTLDSLGIDVTEILESFKPEEWQQFWVETEKILQSQSIEDYAWALPEVKQALQVLDGIPAARPYADWLRQRVDYLEMARESLAEEQVPTPPPPRKPPNREISITVTMPPAKKPTPVEKIAAAENKASDVTKWEKKIARKRVPSSAAELVPDLKSIFAEEGVPPQLVWIAEVESSFDPSARSPVGAVGLFQFMPQTAQYLGLSIDPPDERKDPEKNARAAAQYLKHSHI